LYAVGEIILVVIGILMALQINNWNIYRTERIAEKSLLQNLLQDLEKDDEVFDINIQNNHWHMAVLDSILYEISFNPDYSVIDFVRQNQPYSFYGTFLATRGTYLESLSSGKLSLILSDSLRRQILDYYEVQLHTLGADLVMENDMLKLRSDWNDLVSYSKEYAMAFGTTTNFPNLSIAEISSNPKYGKLIMQKRGLVQAQIGEWLRVKAVNTLLVEAIENELARNTKSVD
jgi:hypothetical protein